MTISSWNVRGLNKGLGQEEVNKFIRENNIEVLGLLETRVKQLKTCKCRKLFGSS